MVRLLQIINTSSVVFLMFNLFSRLWACYNIKLLVNCQNRGRLQEPLRSAPGSDVIVSAEGPSWKARPLVDTLDDIVSMFVALPTTAAHAASQQ
jgi:hypothetical protein